MTRQKPTSENAIGSYIHCGRCFKELPDGMSMKEWSSLSIGFTKVGLQVWCDRHDWNIAHIDFEGQKHPANLDPVRPDTRQEVRDDYYEECKADAQSGREED